ncbi:MAG: hypothetical protein ABIS50_13185 [Luteolibacter sp.]|uniref:hypothetical protein n=1 Tax=Luteolibacter sp. TaxID=1962973 RepID=UPI003265DDA0
MPFKTIPEGLDEIPDMAGTTIRRKWLTWMIAPLALFAVVWDSFLFFWYTTALSKPGTPWMMILFPAGHVAVGIGITYFVIASLANKTDVILNTSFIEVTTGPFPWIGNKRVMVSDIAGIIVRERCGNQNRKITYSVMYAGHDRKEKKFLSSLPNREQADFIAARIREITGLTNEAE